MQRKLLLMVIAVVVAAGCARPSAPPPGHEVYLPPAEAQPVTQPAAGHAEPQQEAPPSLVPAASGAVERFTLAPGEPVPSTGMYFLEVATGKVEGWRLPDSSDRSPYLISYRVSDDGRWVTAADREDTYLIDRRQGRVWAAEGGLETASARLLVLHEGRGRYRVYETTNLREISRFELQTKAYSVEVLIAPDEERLFVIPTRGAESTRLYRVDLPSGRVEEVGDLPSIIATKAIWGAWLRPSRQGETPAGGIPAV